MQLCYWHMFFLVALLTGYFSIHNGGKNYRMLFKERTNTAWGSLWVALSFYHLQLLLMRYYLWIIIIYLVIYSNWKEGVPWWPNGWGFSIVITVAWVWFLAQEFPNATGMQKKKKTLKNRKRKIPTPVSVQGAVGRICCVLMQNNAYSIFFFNSRR